MRVIEARNTAEALQLGLAYLLNEGILQDSRAGRVVVAPGPVTTVYEHPAERALFSPIRDANPFFHLLEAFWMLAGRDDTGYLDVYIKDFGARFAEQAGSIVAYQHGAYGHRWKTHFGFDQLEYIVGELGRNPASRQCVLQMWDATDRSIYGPEGIGANDLRGDVRDRPCNVSIFFRMRRGELDMTVLCRSNDIIMGAYGANAVHFSFLQEYTAARIGVPIGKYWQMSNDFHAYVSDINRLANRARITCVLSEDNLLGTVHQATYGQLLGTVHQATYGQLLASRLEDRGYARLRPSPMVMAPDTFDEDLVRLMHHLDWLHNDTKEPSPIRFEVKNQFLSTTVFRAAQAHALYRGGLLPEAIALAHEIEAEDWQAACVEWLQRRVK